MNIRPRQQKPRISKVGRKWLCIGLNCGAAAHSPWAAYEDWKKLTEGKRNGQQKHTNASA
jgi:hypothetical protein